MSKLGTCTGCGTFTELSICVVSGELECAECIQDNEDQVKYDNLIKDKSSAYEED